MESLGEWLEIAPWKSRLLLFIDLDTLEQTNTIGGKREIIAHDNRLLVIWPGQWASTARIVAPDERERLSEALR